MEESDFLGKLKKEDKLELVEPTEPMSESYEKKSKDCLLSAKLLFKAGLFENSIGEAYYSMYNIVQSIFFRCGIKCENHSAAAILLKRVFHLGKAHSMFSEAKGERIDKQYYVSETQIAPATKESAQDMIRTAENFILEANNYKINIKLGEIKKIREEFRRI